ncbi:MAG: 2,4-dihydroxyhept-2-ene-1,7-dioic acid aldolase [Bacteroidales bacterium]|nr:2,4-dihydroxyhept-2-ene-1,7-dioic acid aldolase [Bacteroidales bacterium]
MNLKERLKRNELTLGSWLTIGHQSIAEIMTQTAFDWLVIDMEHSVIEFEKMQELVAVIQSNHKAALVRVGKNDELIIKRVMDAGATGVIVPMVNSLEQAKDAVSYVKYPPLGRRGVGLARAQKYGTAFGEYKEWLNRESVVVAQIEHIDAVNAIEQIITLDDIDAYIIGPYDLSASMGFPGEYHRQDVKDAISHVLEVCKKHNKPSGFHVIHPDASLVNEKISEGCTFIAFSIDFFFLGNKIKEEFVKINLKD